MSYFPMFIELKNKHCLIVGGGRIACHKANVLKDFGAKLTVIAPIIAPEIKEDGTILFFERDMKRTDLNGKDLVVAATSDKELNHRISRICRESGIPINAVDQPEDCSFLFPAYLKEGEVVAAFSSGGQSPAIAQYLKAQLRPALTPYLGEVAACLGALREILPRYIRTEDARKKIYQELLMLALETHILPSHDDIWKMIAEYAKEEADQPSAKSEPANNASKNKGTE